MTGEDILNFAKKNAIVVACAVLTIAIGVTAYFRTDELPDAERVLAEKTKDGELIAANIEDSKQLKEQHAALVAANQVIGDRMIHVNQLAENLQYFYRLESETGTKLTDLRQASRPPPGKNAPKAIFTPVAFTVAAQGTYPQVMDLLRRLENGEHYCRVLACNLKPSSDLRGSPLILTLNLELMGMP